MTGVATIIAVVLALATAAACGVQARRDRAITRTHLGPAAATEVAVLFYVGVRTAGLIGGHESAGTAIVVAYLAALVLTMPVAAALAWAEPSRWGSVTLASGALITCVLFARINQLWNPHA